MKAAKLLLSAAASAAIAGTADAQFLRGAPALPAAGTLSGASPVLNGVVPPPGLGLGVGPGAQLPGGMNTIWSRLGISQEQREFCRRKICRTPAGQLLGRFMAPVSALSGGIVPPFCPTVPSVAELLDPGAVGAASKAKLDRAGAEERMKAVKYLGTLDCHYWPEAEEALIGALRGDRNECVRYEAAMALARGCCCTCKVIVALSHVVSCSDADGFPYEKSARVRAVAANALDRCMANCNCATPGLPGLPVMEKAPPVTEKGKEEKGKDDKKKDDDKKPQAKLGDPDYPKEYYAAVAKLPREQVGAFGRRALELGANIGYTVVGEINPRDYAAAGMTAGRDGQSSGAKPTTIMELLTWRDSGGSIGKALVGPPPAYAGVVAAAPTPAPMSVSQPAERLVPVPTTTATPPAFVVSQPKPAPIPVAAPVVTMPSSGTAATTRIPPAPLTLKVPALDPTPAKTVSAPKAPVPAVTASNPMPAPKPVIVTPAPAPKPVVVTPAPKPVVVTPAPKPVVVTPAPKPVVVTPAPAPKVVPAPTPVAIPPVVVPAAPLPAPKLPDAKSSSLAPVEKVLPAVEKIAPVEKALPAVEKIVPTLVVPVVDDLPPVEKVK